MVPFVHTTAKQLVLGSAGIAASGVVPFAASWLAICALCALVYWLLALRIFRHRRHRQSENRGMLYVSFFLVAFAGSTLVVEDSFAIHDPAFSLPVSGFFLLFFYFFADSRYTRTWTRWLVLLFGLSQIGPLAPPKPQPANPASTQYIAHIPGGPYGGLVTLGYGAIALFGDMFLITIVVSGILPNIYYRYRHLCDTGAQYQIQRNGRAVIGVALAFGSFLILIVSALFAQSSTQDSSVVYLCVRTGFYLLTTLLPVAIAFALLRGQPYDRAALINRIAIYGTLSICLIAVYVATTGLRLFIPGLLVFPLVLVLIALDVPIMVALYPPLYAQIQTQINRRFFRSQYDATQLLAAYRVTLPEETRLDQLCRNLVAAVQKAMQARYVALWLRSPAIMYGVNALALPVDATPRARYVMPSEHTPELHLRWQASTALTQAELPTLTISSDDPARASLLRPSNAIQMTRLPSESPVASAMRDVGADLIIPLFWQSELVGLLALGERLSGQRYTFDDRELLTTLMDQVTPTLHVAHVTQEQDVEQRQRERVEQELQTARRIQEALLPKSVPVLDGWQLATCYQPAREVGGDFYDFFSLADGRLGLVLGDVTDKGIPAALVMATTRSMLRAVAAHHAISPGEVLAQVNELLCPDLPASMFVTCFYGILDPASGYLRFANAGQDLPYLRHDDGGICELYATGMPLGLMPGSRYEEGETTLTPGDHLLFYSDGLVEAHNPQREMFGLPRLRELLQRHGDGTPPIVFLLHALAEFTGAGWEQEDDITLVALQRAPHDNVPGSTSTHSSGATDDATPWRTLDAWTLASERGNERQAIARVAQAVRSLPLSPKRLEQLKTAVGEATMNAMEHGNGYQPERPVALEVRAVPTAVAVRITDQGGQVAIPTPEAPELGAKLAGLQSPRGWGLFLIKELVDELRESGDATHHTVELIMNLDDTGTEPSMEQSGS